MLSLMWFIYNVFFFKNLRLFLVHFHLDELKEYTWGSVEKRKLLAIKL